MTVKGTFSLIIFPLLYFHDKLPDASFSGFNIQVTAAEKLFWQISHLVAVLSISLCPSTTAWKMTPRKHQMIRRVALNNLLSISLVLQRSFSEGSFPFSIQRPCRGRVVPALSAECLRKTSDFFYHFKSFLKNNYYL